MHECAILGRTKGPWDEPRRWLVLAPHPDDFDTVAVTLRRFAAAGCDLWLDVLTGGASGVEDAFVSGWDAKTAAREAEQRASCRIFGLADGRIRFHRFPEDGDGHMLDNDGNADRVGAILDRAGPEGVILPHGNDSNADHRRTARFFGRWAAGARRPLVALLVRDPKTLGMRLDLVVPFGAQEAERKAELLRCHRSQHERNLRVRGHGLDARILEVNRAIAAEAGLVEPFAEGFEVSLIG